MSKNNEKFKWLKSFLQLFIFLLLSSTVYADNSTDYSDDEMETFLLIKPAPVDIPQCEMNEVYQSCEVGCIDCEQRGMCEPQNCHISHCDCRMYFVHVTPGGPCEHVSMCPPRECPENEVYRHCGPYCEYCDNPQCRSMECTSRCYCKQGYRRSRETEKCVPEKECPERLICLSNDAAATNGSASEHCMQTESEALRANETIEEEKCYCPSGFKRNIHGWCIEEELCPFVTCVEQTVFQDCPRKCNTTCWNYGDPNCQEDGQCYPSCFCDEDHVLNEFFACIPLEMCPPGSNPFVPTLPPPTIGPIPEPALEETSETSAAATAKSGSAEAVSSSSGTGSSSAAAAESSSGRGSSSAAAAEGSSGSSSAATAESSSGTGGSSAAAESSSGAGGSSAAESSSGKEGSSSAAAESSSGAGGSSAAESSSGKEGSSSAAAESSSGKEGSSSAAAESSSGKEGSSSAAAESSSGAGDSSAAAAESSSGAGDSSAAAAEAKAGTESSPDVVEGTEKTKESETKETTPEDETTETPKKPPKKVTKGAGKVYKSAARKGKTVSPPTDEEDA